MTSLEFDHLVSREIGGADVVENLWPQPWTERRRKTSSKNLLHKLVCDGKVPLKTVQAAIAADWRRHVRVHRHHNQVSAYTTIMSLSIPHSKPCGDN